MCGSYGSFELRLGWDSEPVPGLFSHALNLCTVQGNHAGSGIIKPERRNAGTPERRECARGMGPSRPADLPF